MSSNQTFSSSASYSFSSSSSSSHSNGQSTGQRATQQTYTDPSGNTYVKSSSQNSGQPAIQESRQYDSQGRELLGGTAGGSANRRIEDVSDQDQATRDAEYEERMEDEYAKREGGA